MKNLILILGGGLLLTVGGSTLGAELVESSPARFEPRVLGPSDEGLRAIPTFETAEGLRVELVAAEPHLANPVAFAIDEQGRFYVAETFRHGQGVLDIRGRVGWPSEGFKSNLSPGRLRALSEELLDVDLSVRTVADRIAYLKKYMGDEVGKMTVASDRIRRLVDTNGDGYVDESSVFVDGLRNIADGIGAGLLARKGQVYYTHIPDLWRFDDYDQDGNPEKASSLHYGYGVRTGFLGHDLHGLVMGPDGKIYFSIGDRGTHVETFDGRTISLPDTGAVFRCDLDGSRLEVYATGLRNPQELAFDAYGNLFTGDNNSDGGDQARWVYLVEGGDSGWRIGYQFIQRPNARGPWNAEKLWYPRFDGQAAYLIPPLANIGNGPSGLACYPGLGFNDEYNGSFLMVDFKGAKRTSGIHRIQMKPVGAGYEVASVEPFLWQAAATDVCFGYDGAVYFTDWVSGWEAPGKGRLYRVVDEIRHQDPRLIAMKSLMAAGFESETSGSLRALLGHPDMRVRLEAQFELAERGGDSIEVFAEVFKRDASILPQLHAVWGIAQTIDRIGVGRDQHGLYRQVGPLLEVYPRAEDEVRAQICKVLGELRVDAAFSLLLSALRDESPRVQYFAALSLGKLGHVEAVPQLFQLAGQNNDQDVYLRHAIVMALVGIDDLPQIERGVRSEQLAVQRVSLLALRRLKRGEVSTFLEHPNLELVREAALAVNDVPIESGTGALAKLISRPGLDAPTLRRVINANFRLGTFESAQALVRFAIEGEAGLPLRTEALEALAQWATPSGRDRVTGNWRPLLGLGRDRETAALALRPFVDVLLKHVEPRLRLEGIRLVRGLSLSESADLVAEIARSEDGSDDVRIEAIRALSGLDSDRFRSSLERALFSDRESIRAAALELAGEAEGVDLFDAIQTSLSSGTLPVQRAALVAIRSMTDSRIPPLLLGMMGKLDQGELPRELLLELVTAVEGSGLSRLENRLVRYRETLPEGATAARHPELLYGGDADRGRSIFFEKLEVSCLRCHKVNGEGGEAGPNLSGIGAARTREYLLESVLYPSQAVAEGFETIVLDLGDGVSVGGILKEDSAERVVLISPEEGEMEFSPAEIKGRSKGPSAMPEYIKDLLSPWELRDLVEYLASLNGDS